ncbi:transcription activator protein [Corchorus golden mosaic virus [Bangladesh:Tangail:2013]]|uniref:Transcriptional activator protein n=1 Tax=Corchorus golden mosaic virus [Bangladesh:Tangail:2013] TaxID=1517544 RepID=A0A0A8IBJ3_9GEMI|nr:transcription activator protein [Corchorus golden mosaic virus [Bangladesh:Tangail:2013]]
MEGFQQSSSAILGLLLHIKSTSRRKRIAPSMTGPKKTSSSLPSTSHSLIPPIKHRHRHSKKVIRRRRIDLDCGCSIYVSIHCRDDGFTHRGSHHCISGREFRFYLEGSKSPIFQDNIGNRSRCQTPTMAADKIQPQPQESTSAPQVLPEFQGLDDLQMEDFEFLSSIFFPN